MNQVEISVFVSGNETVDALQQLLEQSVPPSSSFRPRVFGIQWADMWSEIVKMALYKTGADVSQLGTPLAGDMLSMNALRPFSEREVNLLGGAAAFHPVAWQSARRGEDQVWAIPWILDPFVVFYWRDMLDKAGVDEGTGFQSFERMEETFDRLRASGVAVPWVLPTTDRFSTLHSAVSWIWGAGGDLVSADGKQPLFHLSQARAGLRAYYDLVRYMPSQSNRLDSVTSAKLFASRQAAATISNPPYLRNIILPNAIQDLGARLGIAAPPGPPLIGGSSLVIWQHSRQAQAALECIRILVSQTAQVAHCQRTGYLPVRLDALSAPPFATDPFQRRFVQVLQAGRLFPMLRMGGMFEDRLASVLDQLWDDVLSGAESDLDALLTRRLESAAHRLETVLREAG